VGFIDEVVGAGSAVVNVDVKDIVKVAIVVADVACVDAVSVVFTAVVIVGV
jgi:hypothetical protein